jgi:hypothetical protein
MKMKKLIALFAAVAMIAAVTLTFAQSATMASSDNWVLIGSHVVDYTLDRDVINLKDQPASFTSLKFKVNNGPINLHKCTVHFSNGETQDLTFATTANAADGRVVDLQGNTRRIEKVTFWYDTKNSADKKAVVEVWGKK